MPSIQIFRPGTVTSMEGVAVSFTDADLRGIAERYDPALHEAPIVVGHPQHDAPAFGWVASLGFADGALVANEHQINDDFAELRRKGSFKKVSARFYTPASPNNPTPGAYYLRDVGFLGAMAPAVKGLRTASFADGADPLVTAELSFGDLHGREPGQSASTASSIASVQPLAAKDAALTTPTPEQLQADLVAANARIAALTAAEVQRQQAARHAEHVSFADGLVAKAQWPAGAKDVLVASLDHLATPLDTGCVSFGDGDAAAPLHQVLREQLQTLPPLVSFAEVAGKRSSGSTNTSLSDRQISDRAAAHRARLAATGQHISIAQALDAVHAGTDKE